MWEQNIVLTLRLCWSSSVSNDVALGLFLCSELFVSDDRLSFFPSSEPPSSFPLSPDSLSPEDPDTLSPLIVTLVPNNLEGNPVLQNCDLECPLLYWYPELRTTCRASGNNSSRRFNKDGINRHNCAAASFTDTFKFKNVFRILLLSGIIILVKLYSQ